MQAWLHSHAARRAVLVTAAVLGIVGIGWLAIYLVSNSRWTPEPVSREEVAGLYVANHTGALDQVLIQNDGSFELRYVDENHIERASTGHWNMDVAGRIELYEVAEGRHIASGGASGSDLAVWLVGDDHSVCDIGLEKDTNARRILIRLHPDTDDAYVKQY